MKRNSIILSFFIIGLIICLTSTSFKNLNKQNDELLKIAKEYKKYSLFANLVDDDSDSLKWTITACASDFRHLKKDSIFYSKPAGTESPHGNKLYKLYVKNINTYREITNKTQPVGQVLVKETWNVKEIKKDSISTNRSIKLSKNDGKWYTPTTLSELFIMYKEQKNEKNDEGWVYGIVSLENNKSSVTVLENGKISTCISCHKDTKYDRIFGAK